MKSLWNRIRFAIWSLRETYRIVTMSESKRKAEAAALLSTYAQHPMRKCEPSEAHTVSLQDEAAWDVGYDPGSDSAFIGVEDFPEWVLEDTPINRLALHLYQAAEFDRRHRGIS